MNKKVTIANHTYEMHQVKMTNWVFVKAQKTGRTYSIAKIVEDAIIAIDDEPALSEVSNRELAEAWLAN